MKNFEKAAIVLTVLWLITNVYDPIFAVYFHHPSYSFATMMDLLLATIRENIVPILVQIGIGCWLFRQALQSRRSQWAWGLFGLTFGISAAILYYLLHLIYLIEQGQSR